MKKLFDDSGQQVMIPDDLEILSRTRILFPATLATIKSVIKNNGVQDAIRRISGYKMTPEQKGAVLFIASGSRLVRKFN